MYEIRTPILKTIADGALSVFNQALAGNADVKQGNLAMTAATNMRRSVETDLKVRLAAPKLKKIESGEAAA